MSKLPFPTCLALLVRWENFHSVGNPTFSFKGGTIGLFTGLSLLSAVEIVYWIYRTILAFFLGTNANEADQKDKRGEDEEKAAEEEKADKGEAEVEEEKKNNQQHNNVVADIE